MVSLDWFILKNWIFIDQGCVMIHITLPKKSTDEGALLHDGFISEQQMN